MASGVETVTVNSETLKKEVPVKSEQELMLEELLCHLKFFEYSYTKDYLRVVSRILVALSSTAKKLENFDFSQVLEVLGDNSHIETNGEGIFLLFSSVLRSKYAVGITSVLSDVTAYVQLLVLVQSFKVCVNGQVALSNASFMMGMVELYQPVIISPLRAKIIYYIYLIYEQCDELHALDSFLMRHLRYCLNHGDSACGAQVLNLIIRTYLTRNNYKGYLSFMKTLNAKKAVNFFYSSDFSEPDRLYQLARFKHYSGVACAVQGDYESALKCLSDALLFSPPNCGAGFKLKTQKYLMIVELMLGRTPEYSKLHKNELLEYNYLAKAVEHSSMEIYMLVLQLFESKFMTDRVYQLVLRLEKSVQQRAIKMLFDSYLSITVNQVAEILKVSPQEAIYLITSYVTATRNEHIKFDSNNGIIYNNTNGELSNSEKSTKLHDGINKALAHSNEALKKMLYDTKKYYNKMAYDAKEDFYIDEDPVDTKELWMKKDNNEGPDAGL